MAKQFDRAESRFFVRTPPE